MRKSAAGLLVALLFPALILAGTASTGLAQEKKAEKKAEKAAAGQVMRKEIAQNDKLRVYEATFKPGDDSPIVKRPMRAVRALKGGTLERTYADGKKETIQRKAGDARILSDERPYAVKNIGKSVVHLYIVNLK